MNPLVDAVYNADDADGLKTLLKERQDELNDCLLAVITDKKIGLKKRVKVAERLLSNGLSPNLRDEEKTPILCLSVSGKQPKLVELLIKHEVILSSSDRRNRSALHYSAEAGVPVITKMLLAAGADVNAKDRTGSIPLFEALIKDSWEVIELLLTDSDLTLTDRDRNNALHHVIRKESTPLSARVMRRLIEEGVNLEARNNYYTPLGHAVVRGRLECFNILVEAGCNINATSLRNYTPLNFALLHSDIGQRDRKEKMKMAECLINAGADVDIADEFGRTPLMHSIPSKKFDMTKQLLEANCSGRVTKTVYEYWIIEFMRCSMRSNMKNCALFMFQDSAISSHELHEYFHELSESPKATANKRTPREQTIGFTQLPISLYRLCRLAVRASLPKGPTFLPAVDQLPIPNLVKDFILVRC